MSNLRLLRRAASTLASTAALFLVACGGGGGGGSGSQGAIGAQFLPPASTLAGVCSVEGQKSWVRSYLNEAYLWSDQVVDVNPAAYSVANYFDALLVRTPTASGQALDRFSATMSSAAANAMQGISGAASPAAAAVNPVPLVRTYNVSGRTVGYILFNQHTRGAQDALIGAFTTVRNAGASELVLDLRYNSGGYIYVAQAAAAMVAGPAAAGRTFAGVRYNSYRSAENAVDSFSYANTVTVPETNHGAGTALPQLGLPRVYVLTSPLTCSASETIINGLRGVGVQVVLIGDRTCGKPYGFRRMDNCGQAYFPIEFQMFNDAGFGDYTTGFPVQCRVTENAASALGDSVNEPLLRAAMTHITTGSCPTGTSTGVMGLRMMQAAATTSILDRPGAPGSDSVMYQPGFDGAMLQP